MSAEASPQTTLGEVTLQRSPRRPSWFQGPTSRQEGNGGEGRTRGGEERKGGERGVGREGKGEVGGIAP